jgi:hypothetical protein
MFRNELSFMKNLVFSNVFEKIVFFKEIVDNQPLFDEKYRIELLQHVTKLSSFIEINYSQQTERDQPDIFELINKNVLQAESRFISSICYSESSKRDFKCFFSILCTNICK